MRVGLGVAVLFVASMRTGGGVERPTAAPEQRHVAGQIVLTLEDRAAARAPSVELLHRRFGLVRMEDLSLGSGDRVRPDRPRRAPAGGEERTRRLEERFRRTVLLHFDRGAPLDAVLAAYGEDPGVEHAELNLIFDAQLEPNDTYFATRGAWGQDHLDLYGVHVTSAPAAWDLAQGSGVVVAVVDTGVDATHRDIDGNVWINPGEIKGNGVDDDGNGYVDDVQGWDFVGNDNLPSDGHGHGTHVAGTIAAEGNNAEGTVGVAFRSSLMPVKGLNDQASGTAFDLARAILYATDNGADVINASWGALGRSQVVEDAVRYAYDRGVVVVAAAGNANQEVAQFTPAWLPEVVTVAASDPSDRKASFSNRGLGIDVTAPGAGILSLLAQGTDFYGGGTHIVGERYYWADGTSMACAHGAGAAALLLSRDAGMTNEEVRDRLAFTADNLDALNPGHAGRLGGGRLDTRAALTAVLGPPVHSVSGTVIDRSGRPAAGVLVQLGEMGSRQVVTGSAGEYAFTGLREGRYTVGPSRLGHELAPADRPYRPLTADEAVQNFVATPRWDVQSPDMALATGLGSSVAVDAQGRPHVSYFALVGEDLRYSKWNGSSWDVQTVDAAGSPGRFTSIALDSQGRPHIAYTWDDGVTSESGALRYARWTGSAWEIQTVDDGGSIGFDVHLALDGADRPHIAYYEHGARDLRYAHWDGSAWRTQTVDASGYVGITSSLALDSQGRPHIAYSDYPTDDNGVDGVKHAMWDGGAWRISVVDGDNGVFGGIHCAIAVDAADRPHVVYSGYGNGTENGNLKYATLSSSGGGWTREAIRPRYRSGFGNSLALGPDGTPHVIYHSVSIGLQHATRVQGEWGPFWTHSIVHPGEAGYENSLAVDGRGALHVAYMDRVPYHVRHARSLLLGEPPPHGPLLWITEPRSGTTVSGLVTVSAAASSSVGLFHVAFFVDGVPKAIDSTAPYGFAWATNEHANGTHLVTARAIDASGRTVEQAVKVQVSN